MEIINRGKLPSERVYTATCTNCGSVLRFTHAEATHHSDQRDGNFVSVKCPVCHHNVTHYEKPALQPYS